MLLERKSVSVTGKSSLEAMVLRMESLLSIANTVNDLQKDLPGAGITVSK